MMIQAGARSALILAAALAAAVVLGFAGTGTSYAAANGAMQPALQPWPETPAAAAPAAADANAAPADQQTAPAMQYPLAGNAVAENTEPDNTATATPDAAVNAVVASSDDNSGWDKASIIGKIFIACGTLLTLGSAARMFMI
jgi:hypothetical protein